MVFQTWQFCIGFLETIPGCFSKMNAKKQYVPAPYHFEVDTAEQCQVKCQERAECEYFQLNDGSHCYLKKGTAGSAAEPNDCCTFGPKYCKGRNKYIFKMKKYLIIRSMITKNQIIKHWFSNLQILVSQILAKIMALAILT